jgi:hypothetical protein
LSYNPSVLNGLDDMIEGARASQRDRQRAGCRPPSSMTRTIERSVI